MMFFTVACMCQISFLSFITHLRRRKLIYDIANELRRLRRRTLNYDVANELRRHKLNYDVVN